MIHVSTDYVFEGNGTRPYTEFDEPNPVSAYGKTKLEGENFVKAFCRQIFYFTHSMALRRRKEFC